MNRTTFVYIDNYMNNCIEGRFYNPYMGEVFPFSSMLDLLVKLDYMFNEMDCPQSFNSFRSFNDGTHINLRKGVCEIPAGAFVSPGKFANFEIKLIFRKNTTWQGDIKWREGQTQRAFRSALELIFLINDACRP